MNSEPITTLWWASVTASARYVDELLGLLDSEERARAARFRVEAARRRFVTARVMLRRVLSELTGTPPEALAFAFGSHGKPQLQSGRPRFNLAHSGDAVVLAVAENEVGVDVEELRALPSAERLAPRICTPRELEGLATKPGEICGPALEGIDRSEALLRLWTAKEAVLKGLGSGIAGGMRSVEVRVGDRGDLQLLEIAGETTSWIVLDAPAPDGAVAAVAVARPSCRLESRSFPPA